MNDRDKNIIDSLKQFRVLDRDQVIELHFQTVKDKVNSCNKVLKRLQRDGHLTSDMTRRPFLYFPNPSTIKKDSGKISHFKNIADFVIESGKLGTIREYEVEVKLGAKGTVEPDLFMIWNNTPFFVEVQLSKAYNKKFMNDKLERYEEYFDSGAWKELHWQKSVKHFPYVLIVSDAPYEIETYSFKVIQVKSMTEFVEKHCKKKGDQ